MTSSPTPKPTGVTNELVKERNRAASERTMTSWIQNCMTIIGFGFGFDQIYRAVDVTFPNAVPTDGMFFAQSIGLIVVALGVVMLLIAIIEYPVKLNAIEKDDYIYRPAYPSNILIVAGVVLFGILSAIGVLVSPY
ncbi:MAG: YidH family protein [Microcoleaceae cyanobacterium]